jgi:hypothetical protein
MVELLDTETQRTGVSYSKRQQKRKRKEQAFPTRDKKTICLSVRVFFCLPLAKKCIENGLEPKSDFTRIEQVFFKRLYKRFVCPFECFFACLLQKNVSRIIYWFQTTFVIIVRSSVFLPASCKKCIENRLDPTAMCLSVRVFFCLPLAKKVSRIIYLFQTTFVIIVRSRLFLPASCKKSITNNLFVPDDICYYCPFECFFACLLQKKYHE